MSCGFMHAMNTVTTRPLLRSQPLTGLLLRDFAEVTIIGWVTYQQVGFLDHGSLIEVTTIGLYTK